MKQETIETQLERMQAAQPPDELLARCLATVPAGHRWSARVPVLAGAAVAVVALVAVLALRPPSASGACRSVITMLEQRDAADLYAMTDVKERAEMNVTPEAAGAMLRKALWDQGAKRATEVKSFITQEQLGRHDWLVTWGSEAGAPIMLPSMAIPHYYAHDNRLYNVVSLHRGSSGWKLNLTHFVRSLYWFRYPAPEARRRYRALCESVGVRGYMDEYMRPHLFKTHESVAPAKPGAPLQGALAAEVV